MPKKITWQITHYLLPLFKNVADQRFWTFLFCRKLKKRIKKINYRLLCIRMRYCGTNNFSKTIESKQIQYITVLQNCIFLGLGNFQYQMYICVNFSCITQKNCSHLNVLQAQNNKKKIFLFVLS